MKQIYQYFSIGRHMVNNNFYDSFKGETVNVTDLLNHYNNKTYN